MDASKDYGSLKNWDYGKFVPVVDSVTGKTYYGGHQRWLMDEGVSKFYLDRSCGVTAITNMLVYMAQNIPEKSNLHDARGYNQTGLSTINIEKSNFSIFQNTVYKQISPAIWGIPTVQTIVQRVENFALERGVKLKAVRHIKAWSESNIREYIANGLKKNCPVLLLTWNSEIPDLNLHWVTITRLYETDSGTKMVTSNWSNKQIFDFSAWVNKTSFHKDVVYFE